jgi:hypothetical protein
MDDRVWLTQLVTPRHFSNQHAEIKRKRTIFLLLLVMVCFVLAPDYESGGQEFESLRARHYQADIA